MNSNKSTRIEYIDALRGFTMILVVFSHIIEFCYHWSSEVFSYNDIFILFRMPLFFFISGFILYKKDKWKTLQLLPFIQKKFIIQIIPTFIFFTIYVILFNHPFIESINHIYKRGYWFTIALFEYFLFYSLAVFLSRTNKIITEKYSYILILCLVLFIFLLTIKGIIPYNISNPLGLVQLKFFPYFIFGILVHKYFNFFSYTMDKKIPISIIVCIFFISVYINNFEKEMNLIIQIIYPYIPGFTGICIVFLFFRKYQEQFSTMTKIGKVLQYIGKKTLDIYLLHYFFLPINLSNIGLLFIQNENPTLELFTTMFLALIVIIMCLIFSYIIRLSPLLEQYLFGVRSNKRLLNNDFK